MSPIFDSRILIPFRPSSISSRSACTDGSPNSPGAGRERTLISITLLSSSDRLVLLMDPGILCSCATTSAGLPSSLLSGFSIDPCSSKVPNDASSSSSFVAFSDSFFGIGISSNGSPILIGILVEGLLALEQRVTRMECEIETVVPLYEHRAVSGIFMDKTFLGDCNMLYM